MRTYLQLVLSLCTIVVFSLLSQKNVLANAVIASPFSVDISAQPGEQVQTPIRLRNTTNKPIVLEISVHDFVSRPTTKEPLYTANPGYSLKNWLRDSNLQPTITIPADRSVEYLATFNVPQSTTDKTYFGGIFFINNSDQPTSIATNVYISVGKPLSNTEVTKLNHELRDSFDVLRSFVSFTIINNGTALFTSSPNDWHIVAYSQSGDEVYKQPINEELRLLPDSSYDYELELDQPLPTGAVKLSVQYDGLMSKQITQSVNISQADSSIETPPRAIEQDSRQTLNNHTWLVWAATVMTLLSISYGFVVRKRRLHQQPSAQPQEDNKT